MHTEIPATTGTATTYPFTLAGAAPEAVPAHVVHALAPATWILREWTDYTLAFEDATTLRVGSLEHPPVAPGHFRVWFENQLGLATLQPMRGAALHGEPLHVEVVARKFDGVDHSLAFLRDMLADLFARGKSLPFTLSAMTGRGVRDAARSPDDLFAFHFFRHHHEELIRAIQAVLGNPHRVLGDHEEMVRIHEVKRVDSDATLLMLRTVGRAHAGPASGPGAGVLQRLQPERVLQRIPQETHDTPENRFILSAAQRMHRAVDRIRTASWYTKASSPIVPHIRNRLDEVDAALRLLLTDRRFTGLTPATAIPAASRVLERKDGYREMTLLWNAFHRVQEPVYARMAQAIDLRDVATLYEFWLLFELIDAIATRTNVAPRLGDTARLGWSNDAFTASFPGYGKLSYQPSYSGKDVYSGITLRPDYVWETIDGRRVVMDAKFRIQYPWPNPNAPDEKNFQASKATTDDIAKMHAYRDAIRGVSAAIVLYPGANGFFRGIDHSEIPVSSLNDLLDHIISGDIRGIGAIPMSPTQMTLNGESPLD